MRCNKIMAVVLAMGMVAGLTACGTSNGGLNQTSGISKEAAAKTEGKESSSEFDVLKVGTMPLTCGIPVLYAEEKGYFKEAGLNVSLELFATGAPINEAIAAKQIDIAVSGFASVYSLANANCTWLADVNTTGGMGLYVRPDSPVAQCGEKDGMIGDTEAIKGLQVLEPLGTAVQYMTESYAEKFGLEPADMNQVNMEFASAYQAFTTGEGDAVAANPPYSYSLEEDNYVKLCSFEAATGVNMCDGCFARNEVVEKRSEEVQLFVDCLVRAMGDMKDEKLRTEYTKKVYEDNAINCSDTDLAHEIEDRAYIDAEAMKDPEYKLGEAWVAITDFLVKAEKITAENAPNVAKSIDSTFVSKTTGKEIKAD